MGNSLLSSPPTPSQISLLTLIRISENKLLWGGTRYHFKFSGQVIPVFTYSKNKRQLPIVLFFKRYSLVLEHYKYYCSKLLLWSWMTCSSTFLKYLLAVLVETPATYILMYCSASSMVFATMHYFQFKIGTGFVSYLVSELR